MKSTLITVSMMIFAFNTNAHQAHNNSKDTETLCKFAPENDLRIPVSANKAFATGISKEAFERVLTKIEEVYTLLVKARGGTLKVNHLWDDNQVNASATRSGKTWIVNAYGGLARHKFMTEDGLMMVNCHEMGHHMGGVPLYSDFGNTWASVEGQSDYFATMKCFRRIIEKDNNIDIVSKMEVPNLVKSKCTAQHAKAEDIAMCQRGSMVGLTLANVLWDLANSRARVKEPMPLFDTPDTSQVRTTDPSHPKAQCRLDTYFNGAICNKSFTVDFDYKDSKIGACAEESGEKEGVRPHCWYKPATI